MTSVAPIDAWRFHQHDVRAIARQGWIGEGVGVSASAAPRLIVGLGTTGLSVARYLSARGEPVRVVDSRERPPELSVLRETLPGVPVATGDLALDHLDGVSEVVVSPGLPASTPLIAAARERGISVVNDIELFARAVQKPVLGVTGSNGKSTVTTLCAELLRAQGFAAPAGGNLGPPALDLLSVADADCYVLELSSFQLETARTLAPLAAAVLNVSADHLDRHASLEEYAGLKEKLIVWAETAVVAYDDARVREMGSRHADPIFFSGTKALERGYGVVEHRGAEWLARDLEPLLPVDRLGFGGAGAAANALAALALAEAMGGERAAALAALERFAGLPHRYQQVAEKRGVRYIDDSKGTNVGASLAAIEATEPPVVLIAGGVAKNADFGALADVAAKLRAVVLIGEAADVLAALFAGRCSVVRAGSMPEAVARAAEAARPGDTVLLSPACASQDMFVDYRDRGAQFARAVLELPA